MVQGRLQGAGARSRTMGLEGCEKPISALGSIGLDWTRRLKLPILFSREIGCPGPAWDNLCPTQTGLGPEQERTETGQKLVPNTPIGFKSSFPPKFHHPRKN